MTATEARDLIEKMKDSSIKSAQELFLLFEIERREVVLRLVLSSTLLETAGHNWQTCHEPSCVMAREVLGVEWMSFDLA